MRHQKSEGVVPVTAVLALVALMIVAGVQPLFGADPKPRSGGTMILSEYFEESDIGYPPKMLRPLSVRQGGAAIETLLRTDEAGRPIPWLASKFEENPKALTVTLTLRKGVKFHDGTDFNAEAVKWNIEQNMSAKSTSTDKIKSVEVVDASTVRVNLSTWDSTLISNFAQYLGLVISPAAFKKNGEQWCAQNPVGTGPFQIASRQQKVRTVFKRFDGYWQKGKPYLDKIEFVPIQDPMTREFSLRKGELDFMTTNDGKNLKAMEKEGFVVVRRRQPAGARALVFDSVNPKSPFADLKIRQAAQHAVDTKAIVATVFHGEHEPTNQLIYKGNWAYNPSVVGYPYDPAKAKKLLAEAGYPNGFKTKITYIATPVNDQLYNAVQAYLKVVGIEAELEPVQLSRYNQLVNGGKWEGMLVAQATNIDVLALMDQVYSGTGRFANMLFPPDYLNALEKGIASPDFKTKQQYTQELMTLISDKHCLFLVLFSVSEFAVSNGSVHDHGLLGVPNTALWTPEDAWKSK